MIKIIKACVFDLDGVIVDTAKYHYLAWKKLADELNINFTKKDNEKLKGVSRMSSLEIILKLGKIELSDKEKEMYADKKNKWYVEYIEKITEKEILPGVKNFIEILKANNMKLAIGSASKNTMKILDRLNLIDYFDSIIDGTKVKKAKPNPEVFLKAIEELKIKPSESVVFEDAFSGIEAAHNAGIKAIGVGTKENLPYADILISTFEDIDMNILKNL